MAGAYSRREWSGVVGEYYGGRLRAWQKCKLHAGCDASKAVAAFGARWQNATWDPKALPAAPVGDPLKLAREMLEKATKGL